MGIVQHKTATVTHSDGNIGWVLKENQQGIIKHVQTGCIPFSTLLFLSLHHWFGLSNYVDTRAEKEPSVTSKWVSGSKSSLLSGGHHQPYSHISLKMEHVANDEENMRTKVPLMTILTRLLFNVEIRHKGTHLDCQKGMTISYCTRRRPTR